MITDFNPSEWDDTPDKELQDIVNTIQALFIATELEKEGEFYCGYQFGDKKACKQLLVYADERGIKPTSNPHELTAIILGIQEAAYKEEIQI